MSVVMFGLNSEEQEIENRTILRVSMTFPCQNLQNSVTFLIEHVSSFVLGELLGGKKGETVQ